MEEIEVWFERELTPYGFHLTPMMYNPHDFSPMRGIMYTHRHNGANRTVKLRVRITPELANDLQAYGRTYQNEVDDYREMVINEIIREVESMGQTNPFGYEPRPIDFTPKKEITKFRFK
jgi:hypothetical protein